MEKNPHAVLPALLTPESSVVLLIDHQPFQIASINSHEPTMIANNVAGLAEGAKVYDIPTILTTVMAQRGGLLIKELQSVFPDQKPIDRTAINSWEDSRVVEAGKKARRKKDRMAALCRDILFAVPAVPAQS